MAKLENNPGTKDLVPDIGPVTSMGQDEAFTYPNSKGSWRELNEKERRFGSGVLNLLYV